MSITTLFKHRPEDEEQMTASDTFSNSKGGSSVVVELKGWAGASGDAKRSDRTGNTHSVRL